MKSATALPIHEPRWKTYTNAVAFLLPALLLWSFALVFLLPRLNQVWQLGGGGGSEARWLMPVIDALAQHGVLILMLVAIAAMLLEIFVRSWARYRRIGVGVIVFLLNSTVLLGLTGMCLAALLVAPALMSGH